MITMAIIVEDCSKLFEDTKYEGLITEIFPPVCSLVDIRLKPSIVQHAISTINLLLLTGAQIVLENIPDYLNVLLFIGGKMTELKPACQISQSKNPFHNAINTQNSDLFTN